MELISFILHFDEHLRNIIALTGPLSYIILFLIIFAETGFVVTPFLPGDSLLFIAGALAASNLLNIWILYVILLVAAILGDSVNYWIGHKLGEKVFSSKNSKFFKREYLEKTRQFYEKHGGKTIILARFVPIVRTFAPFVAGVGKMHYKTFFVYNVVGGFIWVTCLTLAGYFFGNLDIIKHNFEVAIFVIIFISLLPPMIEFAKHKLEKRKEAKTSYSKLKETFKEEHLTD